MIKHVPTTRIVLGPVFCGKQRRGFVPFRRAQQVGCQAVLHGYKNLGG